MLIILIYKIVGFSALVCAYLVWRYKIRRNILDLYRFHMFGLRSELYEMGREGKISCDHELYRSVEYKINIYIRYGHKLTFPYMLLAAIVYKYNLREKIHLNSDSEFKDISQLYEEKYNVEIEKSLFEKLKSIENDIYSLTTRFVFIYACFNALFVIYSLLRSLIHKANRNIDEINMSWVNKDLVIAGWMENKLDRGIKHQFFVS